MKGTNTWSYRPYRPFLTDVGDIYICRVVPAQESIHFEWLPLDGEPTYSVYCRVRGEESFVHICDTKNAFCDITALSCDTDYEFYVEADGKKSRVRLARCGESIGSVVNYLHPDDEAYAFSGRYLCSPSLVRHPDGFLLAAMDLFQGVSPQNLTLIYRSDDEGKTWQYVSELMPCFWTKLFIHKGELYALACSTEYGDLLIGKSVDGGKTFCAPVCLLRGANGKNGNAGVHKNPQNILRHNGRIYETLEWGTWANKVYCHAAMVMSCDENDDLLDPESWHFTPPRTFDRFIPELEALPMNTMTIEGTMVVDREDRILDVMRFGKWQNVIAYEADKNDPDAMLKFNRIIEFPGNYSKFMIKYDEVSDCYYSIATRVYDPEKTRARDLLTLVRSKDLDHWENVCDLFDRRGEDTAKLGFQYVDFEFEGDDIIYLCRTALNQAHSFHDSNYITFHKIENFRNL